MRRGVEPIDITVIRDGEEITLSDVEFPTTTEKGAEFADINFMVYPLEKNLGNVVKESIFQSVNTIKMIWQSLYDLVRGRYGIEAVSGPVGVTETLVDVGRSYGFLEFLYIGVIISINLGVMNLLPLPALDGGRIIFLLIEGVRRRPMKMKVEGYINFVGLVILLLFSAFIILKDVIGLFR